MPSSGELRRSWLWPRRSQVPPALFLNTRNRFLSLDWGDLQGQMSAFGEQSRAGLVCEEERRRGEGRGGERQGALAELWLDGQAGPIDFLIYWSPESPAACCHPRARRVGGRWAALLLLRPPACGCRAAEDSGRRGPRGPGTQCSLRGGSEPHGPDGSCAAVG